MCATQQRERETGETERVSTATHTNGKISIEYTKHMEYFKHEIAEKQKEEMRNKKEDDK